MPDKTENDAVKAEDYNRVVEAHNGMKMEKEKMEKELNEMKGKEMMEKVREEEKKKWEQEKTELLKQQEELKKMNDTKVPKGRVNEPSTDVGFMDKLDKIIPKARVNTERFASKIASLKHFKSPITKEFTTRDMGLGFGLLADAQRMNPDLIPAEARKSNDDIQIRR